MLFLTILLSFVMIVCNNNDTKKEAGKGPITVATMMDTEGLIIGKLLTLSSEQSSFLKRIGVGRLLKAVTSN